MRREEVCRSLFLYLGKRTHAEHDRRKVRRVREPHHGRGHREHPGDDEGRPGHGESLPAAADEGLAKRKESFPIFSARRGEAIAVLPCLVAAAAENALKASWKFGFDVAESGGARRGKRRRTQMLI